jgi:hypothetical protein
MLIDALPRPAIDASRPGALAAWLAAEIGAEALVVAAGAAKGDTPADLPVRRAMRPDDLHA